MSSEITRRTFIGSAAAASAASAATALPTRALGRTGARPSILALGCGSRLLAYGAPDKAAEAVNLAIDSGITYIDTAQAYGDGKSETWVGEVLKTRRKEVFLATKIRARDYDEAARWTEGSFKRLQTDQVDLIHIHNLWGDDDLEAAEKGVLKLLLKLRDEKACRFIGVTSHTFPETLAKALERHDFDCTQMALNAALQGRSTEGKNLPPVPENSFERIALPVAKRKNLGVIAMKVTAQEGLLGQGAGKADIEPLLRYSLSLPVSVAVVGMPQLDHIRQNTQLARSFTPMPQDEMQRFSVEMSEANKLAVDRHFCCHEDA
ncbi:MAG: aldo/keto reductase [Acidobacteria bacterium]|nr:aldo/keto reductase [Acidobacteriota bacterium]